MNLEASFHPFFLAFALLALLLITGIILRARIPFLQQYLVPSCLLGGLLGFVLMNTGLLPLDTETFGTTAFHLFSLSNISIGLAVGGHLRGQGKAIIRGGLWMALMFPLAVSLQAITGGLVVWSWNQLGNESYEGLGFLVGLGFSQGPGQTIAIADIWQSQYAVPNAVTIGLAFAAIGYLVSLLVGVPLANWGIRKGFAAHAPSQLPVDFRRGIHSRRQQIQAGLQTTHSANVDTLAFHLAVVAVIYGLSYLLCYFLKYYVLEGPAENLTFNYIYAYGLLLALITRALLNRFGLGHLIDNQIQTRITGSMVDFLILSTLLAIEIQLLAEFLIPMLITAVMATLLTVFLMLTFGRRSGSSFGFERTMLLFGTCTGSVATGLLLIRIVDPEFKTPVILEISLMNLFVPVFMAHIILLIGIIPDPATLSFFGMLLVFLGTAIVMVAALFILGFFKKQFY
jgi:ESS family glutamate:Na+ symporter